MKRKAGPLVIALALLACAKPEPASFRDGDIIFHTSRSAQSRAVRLATGSPYSHMGILRRGKKGFVVLEAVQPVKTTPLETWIRRGEGSRYVVRRLKNAEEVLTPGVLKRMDAVGRGFLGKDYDLFFGWSDDRIYCSELVWKIYERGAGVRIGEPRPMGSFDLTHPEVRGLMAKRYGGKLPLDEPMISPADMFDSDKLETVPARP